MLGPTGAVLSLTDKEYALLTYLIEHSGTLLSKSTLHQQVFPDNKMVDPHRIEVILSRMRQKARAAGMELPIRVIFGKGLAFVPPDRPD